MTLPIYENDLFGVPTAPRLKGELARRFGVPPFSVLDARQGPWQARKRAWLRLGIQSELGRGVEGPARESARIGTGTLPLDRPDPVNLGPAKAFNSGSSGDLSAKLKKTDYVRGLTYQMTNDPYDRDATDPAASGNGTSIFDPVLCELLINWFSAPGAQIVDPFAGGSVRGVVAGLLGRRYWGCDLSAPQIAADREQGRTLLPPGTPVGWHNGDARAWLPSAPEADLILTCPPYYNLEVYSDDPRDLSAMGWPAFRQAFDDIAGECGAALRPDRFACIVVGDVRTPFADGGAYRDLPGAVTEAFRRAGMRLYNSLILVTAVGSLAVRADRQFRMSRKVGTTHQTILVFVKGDGRRATDYVSGLSYEQRQRAVVDAREARRGAVAPKDE